jgi:hypothetical protein
MISGTCGFKVFAGTGDGAINITAHGISGLPSTFTLSDLDDVCELGRGTCSIVRRVRHRASSTDLALKPISIGDKEHRFCIRCNHSLCNPSLCHACALSYAGNWWFQGTAAGGNFGTRRKLAPKYFAALQCLF